MSCMMYTRLLMQVYWMVLVLCSEVPKDAEVLSRTFIYNDTYLYDMIYNVTVNSTTDQILEFKERNETWLGYPTRVHVSSLDNITSTHPLFVTATQQKGVSAWELPLVVETPGAALVFTDMARTLCPHDAGPHIRAENRPRVQLSTSSVADLSVAIKLRRVRDFYVPLDTPVPSVATPSAPKYYYYSFGAPGTDAPSSVMLVVESDDDLCAIVSVQNNSCPVFDNEREVLYQGFHLTMTRKGAITLQQSTFPHGFYVVLLVKESDEACAGPSAAPEPRAPLAPRDEARLKTFRFRVTRTLPHRQYAVAALLTLALVFAFYALIELVALCRYVPYPLCAAAANDDGAGPVEETRRHLVEEEAAPGTSQAEEVPSDSNAEDASSVCSSEVAAGAAAAADADDAAMSVAALCRTRAAVRARRSQLYVWHVITVAVVYSLPVVQLLATYQQMAVRTGDQDVCYYNSLCAHPLGSLRDFNHVYSNVAYVVLGALFIAQVRRRQRSHLARPELRGLGVPQHYGLLYSLGVALVTEGALSACYHLCPNKMNFQFDSSFMYVTAALCIMKLYQSRHPDVAARAHATFLALAALFAVGVVGTLAPTRAFWAGLTLLHVAACLALTAHLYYFGATPLEWGTVSRAVRALRAEGARALRPRRKARLALLLIANVANWALAAYGLYEHRADLARHLLLVLVANATLYSALYVGCKLAHRERLSARAALFCVGAQLGWALAIYFFTSSRTKWARTAAGSRELNSACSWLGFYDTHDLWHLASAAAMYLSFNLLLSVDDAQRRKPRHELPVF